MTFWYGIDVGALPAERQLGLAANLQRVQAQDRIHRKLYDLLDYEGIHELYLEAYGNENLADAAQLASLKCLVKVETS